MQKFSHMSSARIALFESSKIVTKYFLLKLFPSYKFFENDDFGKNICGTCTVLKTCLNLNVDADISTDADAEISK